KEKWEDGMVGFKVFLPSISFVPAVEFCFCVVVFGRKTATGRILGTVTDQTGAVIPGASIAATNVDTKVVYQTVTNEAGLYQVPLLPIGTYTVSAEIPGFQKVVSKSEKLEINQSLRVDIRLTVSNRSEEVTIDDNAITRVETTTATLGMSVIANQIASMPLNGRNTLELALLQPGVVPTASAIGGTGTFNVAGGRSDSVTYLLDGGVNNNLFEQWFRTQSQSGHDRRIPDFDEYI